MASLGGAVLAFVLSHLVLSSIPVRTPLIRAIGAGGFRIFYSVVAIGTFVWMALAYGDAPRDVVFASPAWSPWVPIVVMPIALLLLVSGFTVRSLTAVA